MPVKLAILVQASHGPLYDDFRKTWQKVHDHCQRHSLDCKVYFVYAEKDKRKPYLVAQDQNIVVNLKDSIIGPGGGGSMVKMIAAMDHLVCDETLDYMTITNLSSVMLVDRLLAHLESCPRSRFIAGFEIERLKALNWGVTTFSRDVAQWVIDNRGMRKRYTDACDIVFSKMLQRSPFPKWKVWNSHSIFFTARRSGTLTKPNLPENDVFRLMHTNDSFFWVRIRTGRKTHERKRDLRLHERILREYYGLKW